MAAQVEYEVREEYKDYSLEQLLEAPVNCFQGVGDNQSELLARYFNVSTVKQLADLGAFLEALSVQETVLQGGEILNETVDEVAKKQSLSFHIRKMDQTKKLIELPDAPVHVLEGLTPGQDLALYDSFRITNLTHLAHNRIMLEARVIEYLAQQDSGEGTHTAGQDAIASILGARAAAATTAQARAQSGEFDDRSRIQNLAGEVTDHVRDRVEAMRDRTRDRSGDMAAERLSGAGVGDSRLASIRETRQQGGPAGRGGDIERMRTPPPRSRAEAVLAARGTPGMSRDSASTIADSRATEGLGRPSAGGRADSVLAARQALGRGAPPTSASGGAMVRTRTKEDPKAAQEKAAKEKAAKEAKEKAAKVAATELPSEEEVKAQAAARRRKPARRPNPLPLVAAAAVIVLVLAGLIWFLVSSGGPDESGDMASRDQSQTDQGTSTESQPAGAAGTQGKAAVAPPPPRIQAVHAVRSGESLWRISQEQYSDPLNWPSIFMENRDQIQHPDVIQPAQEFRIPSKPEYRFPEYPEGYRRTR